MFWRRKDSMKRECYAFIDYKQRNEVPLVYSECKLNKISISDPFSSYNERKAWKKHI